MKKAKKQSNIKYEMLIGSVRIITEVHYSKIDYSIRFNWYKFRWEKLKHVTYVTPYATAILYHDWEAL